MSSLRGLIQLFSELQNIAVDKKIGAFSTVTLSGGGNIGAKAFVLSDVLRNGIKGPVLWIVNDTESKEQAVRACEEWFGNKVAVTPFAPDIADEYTAHLETLMFLSKLEIRERGVFVVPYEVLMRSFPAKKTIIENQLHISTGQAVSNVELFEALIAQGYTVSDDDHLEPGAYRGKGGALSVFPVNSDTPIRIEFEFDKVVDMYAYDQSTGNRTQEVHNIAIYPINIALEGGTVFDWLDKDALVVEDELEITDENFNAWDQLFKREAISGRLVSFTSFPEDTDNHVNLRYLSVLKYQNFLDLSHDIKEKSMRDWRVLIFTKHGDTIAGLLEDKKVQFFRELRPLERNNESVAIIDVDKETVLPQSFQAIENKILVISDRDIANIHEEKRKKVKERIFWEFLTSLKKNDLVVHVNHGIARFEGLERRMVDDITREYLKLAYAENDKLFVPIDQADKVNKFIGAEGEAPKLTRLGSAEWATMTRKVRKESEAIAKELLELYAKRKQARGHGFMPNTNEFDRFARSFPYEETPGQIKAINDVIADMERAAPMDRLICGDVGFGKTEVAMRAAFKAVKSGKQVALISPITILADQHYRSFTSRMDEFHIRVEMLSRFRSQKEQQEVLKKLARGEVDIVVGTHRLLQKDVEFKNLGLVIIDEEQRFGVKQKEQFKKMRAEVDILTLTATPIPRTLNVCLNKLRDISTITTPPPGRLPVITEVRKYSNDLIREAILREIQRGGQVYFLHNRVQTIDGLADRLRQLVPEARFGVAHGKLLSKDLEERIVDFKEHKFDVLVSSTIIENGIDLANANTLIVNNAEKFGLAQLYQLRGRVGRSKKQAFAYFLYQSQRLRLDAKKRLRAIVEASELGSGFQIAMKDLEIRGAGDILGVNQHGVINVVGVSHFLRMLNKAVEDLQAGRVSEDATQEAEVSVELPIPAYIPDDYIVNAKEKINTYQRMAGADSKEYLNELRDDLIEDYGKLPREVANLLQIIELKMNAKKAGITVIKAENIHMSSGKRVVLFMSKHVKPENIVYMLGHNSKWTISGTKMYIDIKHLGLNWFEELKQCIHMLGEEVNKEEIAEKNGKKGSVAK
ncbi:transcription-repair coupling factor [Candidatus Peregrinibacteria bacterium CG11_big_fil_rev_8_21_14_0_20_46_8]|nr:MAG: transcription-repair coupling factor [Candidatus Peregrinibacteria bacterium CG11_big_fil_rev_8_21_14_0_20_46_8]